MKKYDVIVVGAGAAGLVIANGCVKANKKVLLIEKGNFGGDCTNFGCIPSKSLIASAHVAHQIKEASNYGLALKDSSFIADNSLDRVRSIIERIKKEEDKRALEKNGVDVLVAKATFESPYLLIATCENGDIEKIQGKKIILGTGSSPRKTPIKGIENIPYLTNETIFSLKKIPDSLLVIGGGPIGCELAQAFCRLGSKLTLIHSHELLLTRESKDTSDLLKERLIKEGILIHLNQDTTSITLKNKLITLNIQDKTTKEAKLLSASHILLSAGRVPNIHDLSLEKAKVAFTEKGITTNAYKQTSQKHIFAIGDCSGPPFFTHLAEYHARCLLQTLLTPFKKKAEDQPVPRVTYTDPEIATLGLLEQEAIQKYGEKRIMVYTIPLSKVDRAITQGKEEGFISIITTKWKSKILGATIIAPSAGEMLMEISLAIKHKIPLKKLASIIHPYPIYCRGIRKAADQWLAKVILPLISRKK